jgi:hypothetical protein
MKILNGHSPAKLFVTVFFVAGLPCLTLFILFVNAVMP